MSTRLLAIALSVTALLTGCGGGGSSDEPATPQVVKREKLLVIGNSLTYVPAGGSPESGTFTGDWGVAASSREKDFAHLTAAALGLPVEVGNYAPLERDPAVPVPSFAVTPGTVVVVQLGDNGLPARYAEIMAAVKSASAIACVSTWWGYPDRDAVMKAACEAVGGHFVYVGDLKPADVHVIEYTNTGVNAHPHDWGMARIAERVVAALR